MIVDGIMFRPRSGFIIRPIIQIIDDSDEWESRNSEWKANAEHFAYVKMFYPKEFGDLEWCPDLTF